MTALDAVREVATALGDASVPSPRVDAEHLVAHVLGISRTELYVIDNDLTQQQLSRLRSVQERRRSREPLAYILGEWGFRRLTLGVDARALVPRPETEVVVERCLALLDGLSQPRVVDIGTGSGAIALALADEHPGVRVTAVDRSAAALALADENSRRAGVDGQVELRQSDLFAAVEGPFDLVVANPPYVETNELESLEPEVRLWEPREALVGPELCGEIATGARDVLRPGGWLVLECAAARAADVRDLLYSRGYADVVTTADLAGLPRVVEGRFDG